MGKKQIKGKRLEYQIRDRFRKYIDPDCKRQLMSGADEWNPADIRFSKKIPYNLKIEAKNQEKYNLWKWWEQTKAQASEFDTPLLVFTKNHKDVMVALRFEDFMKIYEELYDLLQQQESEEEVRCEHSNNLWKIKNIKKLANEFLNQK